MGALNMNMNMNMNMAAGILSASGGPAPRVRYNTQDWWKDINVGDPLTHGGAATMHFPEYWDADLRSYVYLSDFLGTYGSTSAAAPKPLWRQALDAAGIDLVPTHQDPNLNNEVQGILTVALDREDRFLEII